jgi:hypothetical protein
MSPQYFDTFIYKLENFFHLPLQNVRLSFAKVYCRDRFSFKLVDKEIKMTPCCSHHTTGIVYGSIQMSRFLFQSSKLRAKAVGFLDRSDEVSVNSVISFQTVMTTSYNITALSRKTEYC